MTNETVGITHIWPCNRCLCPDAKPFSHENEADVWYELCEMTLNEDVRGQVYIFTHERDILRHDGTWGNNHDIAVSDISKKLTKYEVAENRVGFVPQRDVDLEIYRPATKEITLKSHSLSGKEYKTTSPAEQERVETKKERVPFNLGVKADAKWIIGEYRRHRVCALVLWKPEFNPYDDGHYLKFLPMVRSECPDLPIYIFHNDFREDGWGVEREGSGNWENEFPALVDCKLEPQEVIVDDLLIKGNIHVAAGRFESYKTMALLEWCSAILDVRPVHDHFKVLHRYPILYLCADMSPEQLNEYAGLFGLQKHGKDFRVRKPASDILHSVDSPVVQAAVNGRILILDTMLDFAEIREAFQSAEWIVFMQKLRTLMTTHGCVAIMLTAHATKSGAEASGIDPSAYLKDSATFGGKVDIAYAFKRVPDSSQVLVERIKGRGFKRPLKFTIAVTDDGGQSNLDRGCFPVYQKPGEVSLKEGKAADDDKQRKLDYLRTLTGSMQERTDALNQKFNADHPKGTIHRWVKEIEFDGESG